MQLAPLLGYNKEKNTFNTATNLWLMKPCHTFLLYFYNLQEIKIIGLQN